MFPVVQLTTSHIGSNDSLAPINGLYGPRCPLSPERPLNLITRSLTWHQSGNKSLFEPMMAESHRPPVYRKFNTWRLRQNGHHFAECIFFNEKVWISMKTSLKFVRQGPIDNKSALVHVMAWHVAGNKRLPKPVFTKMSDAMWHHFNGLVQERRNSIANTHWSYVFLALTHQLDLNELRSELILYSIVLCYIGSFCNE